MRRRREKYSMKFNGKALLGIFSVLAITFGAAGCGDVKVGYVNQERITEECPQIKASVVLVLVKQF